MKRREICPVLSREEYRAQNLCYQTASMGPSEIEPNVVYRDGEQIKFLLLLAAISPDVAVKSLGTLRRADWARGSRAANGQKYGTKLTMGWLPPKAFRTNYTNIRTAPTVEQPMVLSGLYPLLQEMDNLISENLPEYHQYAFDSALRMRRPEGEEDDLSRITKTSQYQKYVEDTAKYDTRLDESLSDEDTDREYARRVKDPHKIVQHLDPWNWLYTIRGTAFSTVELNRNIVFKAHEDGGNVPRTCVCMTALGDFVGGRIVFPRYGYSAELEHGDVLICDNNRELHGNLGPIVGERFSVVAFQHKSLLHRVPEEE